MKRTKESQSVEGNPEALSSIKSKARLNEQVLFQMSVILVSKSSEVYP